MLPIGIESIKDLVETAALLVGTAAVVWGVLTYRVARNQFNFSVMISCIERFQKILPELKSADPEERLQAIKQYVDLCNEELFYFKNRYIPDEVIDEWVEGMAVYLPWLNDEGKNLNPDALPEIIEQRLLDGYPRVRRAFTVARTYDFESIQERINLIDVVRQNLKRGHYRIS